jgi:hypothetical protein
VYQTSVPTSGVPRVQISQGANYLGQAGMRIDTPGSGDQDTNIFAADAAGTGGWTPYSFGIVGPEMTRNSTGRTDMNIRTGGGFWVKKFWTNMNNVFAGIEWGNTQNELQFMGTMPHGAELGDAYNVFRVIGITTASGLRAGSHTWGTSNGWSYRPFFSPNATSTTVPMYANAYTFSATGFSWRQNDDTDNMQVFAYRGSFDV